MKPVFCGNFEYHAREGDLERLFKKYRRAERVDMKAAFSLAQGVQPMDGPSGNPSHCHPKRVTLPIHNDIAILTAFHSSSHSTLGHMPLGNISFTSPSVFHVFHFFLHIISIMQGFAFVYMEDERDAEDAIRALDRFEFGRKGRRLCVEWTKGERGGDRRSGGGSRRSSSMRPSKTMFVINFDAENTRTRDLEKHFEPYGKIVKFIHYLKSHILRLLSSNKLMDKVISVEYAMNDDDARGNGYNPERRRDRSPERRRRSPSPYKRERGSPDYGRWGSHVAVYKRERTSPDYGRRRSPSPYKRTRRSSSPEYGRDRHRGNESPQRRDRVANPRYGRSPDNKRERLSPDHSPFKKESSKNGDGEVDSPNERRERSRSSPENGQVESPFSIERRTVMVAMMVLIARCKRAEE
ncbi:hypothetical protein N665_0285s0015 [Sinapis alba]|nr:hypothetical protein N665_0285s0015 [Sinapis alba]